MFYRPLDAALPLLPDHDLHCRLGTLDDLESLRVFEPYRRRAEFRDWLQHDAWLFLALDGNRPVAFQCFAHAVPTSPPLSRIELTTRQVWTVDVYTLPEYRQRSVAQHLRAYRDGLLRERGYEEYVSSVREDNLPALSYAYGGKVRLARRIERLTYVRFLCFSRTWLQREAARQLEKHLEAGAGQAVAGAARPGTGPTPSGNAASTARHRTRD